MTGRYRTCGRTTRFGTADAACQNDTMTWHTADLSDEYAGAAIAEPIFRDFGGRSRFAGPIQTVRCHEDNTLVRAMLEGQGHGAVLVVDGGGSEACALLGDQLATLAIANGWSGVIINGCVRDTDELHQMELGVHALGAHPRRSDKLGRGEQNVPVSFAGVTFVPGQWIYADADGILVLAHQAADG